MSKQEYLKLDNKVLSIAEARERRLTKSYQSSLTELRKYFSELFSKYGNEDGTMAYGELVKYNRYKNSYAEVKAIVNGLYAEMASDIDADLREVYALSYNTSEKIIEKVTGSTLRGFYQIDALDKALKTPVGGLTIDLRFEQLELDLTNRIMRTVTSGLSQDKTWKQIGDEMKSTMQGNGNSIARIVRTEGHRLEETAKYDTAKKSRKKLLKEWVSERDSVVRNAHKMLDGTKIELDEYFSSVNGGYGLYPSAMGEASDDINCRCYLNYVLA